jgi:hypothetical protein
MTVRHVVCFTWSDDASPDAITATEAALRALPGLIEEVRAFSVGPDLALAPGTSDLALVADFDDAEAWQQYQDHPAHQRVVVEHVRPILATRAAVQFEV